MKIIPVLKVIPFTESQNTAVKSSFEYETFYDLVACLSLFSIISKLGSPLVILNY